MTNETFYAETRGKAIKTLKNPNDPSSVNWAEGKKLWGSVIIPEGITYKVSREFTQRGTLKETYSFKNKSEFPRITLPEETGIHTPLNGNCPDRCHTHIWCGGTSSYVMGLRLGGGKFQPGLVLTRGSLESFSTGSDPGDYILHPPPMEFEPGETKTLEWELFWHSGKDDFFKKIRVYPSYIEVKNDHFIIFRGEKNKEPVTVTTDKKEGIVPGERIYTIKGKTSDAWFRTRELPPLQELTAARCSFITEKQQYCKPGSALDGAYLFHDNGEKHIFYRYKNEINYGMECTGMGILMARYLRIRPEPHGRLSESFKNYLSFFLRELFDSKTGMVYDDILRSSSGNVRLDNFPSAAMFLLELQGLWDDNAYLRYAWLALKKFYELGGECFYAANMPMLQILNCLEKAKMEKEYSELKRQFKHHADKILSNGIDDPAEPAAAAIILMQAYLIFGNKKYYESGKKHMEILSLYSGRQPDACLFEIAIQYRNGFRHGKYLHNGTFSHYRSAINGMAHAWYSLAGGREEAQKTADDSFRSALYAFLPDGSVGGENNQDWGLYYALRFFIDANGAGFYG